jgi:hypothetical protein
MLYIGVHAYVSFVTYECIRFQVSSMRTSDRITTCRRATQCPCLGPGENIMLMVYIWQ